MDNCPTNNNDDFENNFPYYKRPVVQWYPGHISKAERQVQETMTAVLEVLSLRQRQRKRGHSLSQESNHRHGAYIHARRQARGLLAHPRRVGCLGFPNAGKSALINKKLLGRRRAREKGDDVLEAVAEASTVFVTRCGEKVAARCADGRMGPICLQTTVK